MRTYQFNQLNAHGFHVKGCILTEEEQDLKTVNVEELACELTGTCTVVVFFV